MAQLLVWCGCWCGYWCCLWAGSNAAAALPTPQNPTTQRIIVLPDTPQAVELDAHFWLAPDPSGTRTLAQIQQAEFVPATSKIKLPSDGGAVWLRLTVSAHAADAWYLDIEPPWVDSVTFYSPDPQGHYSTRHTGDKLPFSSREVAHASYAFRLAPSTAPQTYYVRLQSQGSVWVRAVLRHQASFIKHSTQLAHAHGVEMGALLVLMLLAALHGLAFKDRIHAVFAIYVAVITLQLGVGTGFLVRYVLFDLPYLADVLPPFSSCLSLTVYAVFCRHFLSSDPHDPYARRMVRLFYGLAGLGLAGALLVTVPALRGILPLFIALSLVGAVVFVLALSRSLLGGRWSSRVMWLGLVVKLPAQGIFLSGLMANNQSGSWSPMHWFVAAMVLHLVLLSFALVERARRIDEERRALQVALSAQCLVSQTTQRLADEQRSFLSMVAHELRSPLAAARSAAYNLSLLLQSPHDHLGHGKQNRVKRIETSLVQMAALIDVCLVHEQCAQAQALSMQQRLTLNEVLTQARSNGYSHGTVATRLVWPDASPATHRAFNGNAALLAIALKNLIENACRYDTTGQAVHISADHSPTSVSLCVRDRGPGLTSEQVGHLFEPFVRGQHQAPTPEGEASGLGLGLYIVRRIAGMHDAQATWQPRNGGGSVFAITLMAQATEIYRDK